MRPLLVLVIKGTYAIGPRGLQLAAEQAPLCLAGQHWGEPEKSSYRYEPECAFIKLTTDVVLVGHVHAPDKDTRELLLSLRVGPVQKHAADRSSASRHHGGISWSRLVSAPLHARSRRSALVFRSPAGRAGLLAQYSSLHGPLSHSG
ncbi:DUF2169 domain-containing protein [Archangium sp.]|uniref:DUF2169 domain-containing protein n=1 Tax=Archangium sp. TaxID=1872627 RepID=UPI0039C8A03C